jgi:hypothetical protein
MIIGSYTISDWQNLFGSDQTRTILKTYHPTNHAQRFERITIFKKTMHESAWSIIIVASAFDLCYKQMYNRDASELIFYSQDAAKQHVDTFLDKLCKLKAFL